jgi:hypothetical protein
VDAAAEFLTVRDIGVRTRRVRQEGDLRLATETAFDRGHPWRRASLGATGELGHARAHPHPRRAGLFTFVPDAGEARLVPEVALRVRLSQSRADREARRATRAKARRQARRAAA